MIFSYLCEDRHQDFLQGFAENFSEDLFCMEDCCTTFQRCFSEKMHKILARISCVERVVASKTRVLPAIGRSSKISAKTFSVGR